MSVAEIEQLLHNYRAWLKDKTTLRQVNGEWVEITTLQDREQYTCHR